MNSCRHTDQKHDALINSLPMPGDQANCRMFRGTECVVDYVFRHPKIMIKYDPPWIAPIAQAKLSGKPPKNDLLR